jgi:serine/threonine protein kinase
MPPKRPRDRCAPAQAWSWAPPVHVTEQARGKEVDTRSDVFSLGAVIYEMVSGQKPFDGETPSDTLAAILKTEPPPISELMQDAPPELVRIVHKTLRKDREERYQVVKELLLDLRALKQDLEFQEKMGSARPSMTARAATVSPSTPQTAEVRNSDLDDHRFDLN